jgi:N6-L-threonylcarbamoyladenine synthase
MGGGSAHEANLDLLLEQALSVADAIGSPPLRLIAVTAGPGLKPCLSVGIDRAKNLSLARQLPLLPVHHLEAHALVTRLPQEGAEAPSFPFLLLLVSGGHTQLIACDRVGEYRILGVRRLLLLSWAFYLDLPFLQTTLDDAVGEAFDKTARLLGIEASPLCHPGEQLESLALGGNPKAIPFTRPLQRRKGSCEFSYSGLKTQVRRYAIRALVESKSHKNYSGEKICRKGGYHTLCCSQKCCCCLSRYCYYAFG